MPNLFLPNFNMEFEQVKIKQPSDKVSKCCLAETTRDQDTYYSEAYRQLRTKTVHVCNTCGKQCQRVDRCAHYPVPHTVIRSASGRQYARCGKCKSAYEMK